MPALTCRSRVAQAAAPAVGDPLPDAGADVVAPCELAGADDGAAVVGEGGPGVDAGVDAGAEAEGDEAGGDEVDVADAQPAAATTAAPAASRPPTRRNIESE
jgi:hypothetical protein